MAVTRFFRPQQQEYVSQFIPKNLGVMQNALQLAQGKSDETQKGLDVYEDELLKRKAFGESDTAYLKGKREEFDEYVSELSGQDLSSPKVARDVSNYIRGFKGDEGLGKVQQSYEQNVAAQKAIDKLHSSGKYNPANVADYIRSAQQYSKTGFAGAPLADNAFSPDVDVREGMEKVVNSMKANGYGYDSVNNEWIHSASGKVLTGERLLNTLNSAAPDFMQSQAGQQLARNAAYEGVSPGEAYSRMASSVAQEYAYKDTSTGIKDNSNYWKKKEEAAEQATAFWENGTTKGILTEYETVGDIDNAIETLGNSNVTADKRKSALLLNQRKKLNKKFNSNLSKKDSDMIKFENLSEDMKVSLLARNLEQTHKRGPKMSDKEFVNLVAYREMGNYSSGKSSINEMYAESTGVDYGDLNERRDGYLSKQYVEETSDILLDAGKAGKLQRGYAADALSTYVDETNYDIKGSERGLEDIMSNINPQSIKVRSSSGGPSIVFKTKGNEAEGIEAETITVQHKGIGKGQEADKGVRQLYSALTGGDKSKFGRVMSEHTYANLIPMENNVEYNAIEETAALGIPEVNYLLQDLGAKDVQYKKEGENVNLYINGMKQAFDTSEGETLQIKDIPTLIEVMKYQAIRRYNDKTQ